MRALGNSVRIMIFLAANTKILVPRVLYHDTELSNEISAPYIAMQHLPGVPPLDIWYGQKGDGTLWKDEQNEVSVDTVEEVYHEEKYSSVEYHPLSTDLERKRQTLLKSLATHEAEFRRWNFAKLGSPILSEDGGCMDKYRSQI
jgi:hypothetical protein